MSIIPRSQGGDLAKVDTKQGLDNGPVEDENRTATTHNAK